MAKERKKEKTKKKEFLPSTTGNLEEENPYIKYSVCVVCPLTYVYLFIIVDKIKEILQLLKI